MLAFNRQKSFQADPIRSRSSEEQPPDFYPAMRNAPVSLTDNDIDFME